MKTLLLTLAGAMLIALTASTATLAYHQLYLSEVSNCTNSEGRWMCYTEFAKPENAEKVTRLLELYQQYPASKKKNADI